MSNSFNEPPIDPIEDTTPSLSMRPLELSKRSDEIPAWRRMTGLVSLLVAAGLTIATILVINSPSTPPVVGDNQIDITQETIPSATPVINTPVPTDSQATPVAANPSSGPLPTVDPAALDQMLTNPIQSVTVMDAFNADARDRYDPFTTIPDRQRSSVIQYTVVRGDTINGIAERFGVQPETIAWSNPRSIVWTLIPGDLIYVPPADGVYIYNGTTGSRTIAEIVASYNVDDPYLVLDSPYNDLPGMTPETVPPSGTKFFIPGGTAEDIVWTPPVTEENNVTYNGVTGNFVTFASSEPGSCGPVLRGAGTQWIPPLLSGTWTRGFSSWHSGVDLSAPIGTAVSAANGGTVVFRGWNSFGYGNTIVLSHGPYLTLYGHLSDFNVGCGQTVSAGQTIGFVGNTGNSSGPHLHFEVRYGDTPTDPATIFAF